ncbi:MAG: response regulator [Chloroflexi bacterium]|nr:response regulator [Chloroflexota bacterium]
MGKKVLLVDDDARVRRLMVATLGDGYTLLEAADGLQGLGLARREQPDVVLLDVMMPGLDGFEVCRRLKADPATTEVAVIMLTGLDSDEDRARGEQAGAAAYLVKPFSPRALLDLLSKVLD